MIKVDFDPSELLSPSLKEQFAKIKPKFIDKEYDFLAALEAYEGDGKSTLGILLCSFHDSDFNDERIIFTAEEFAFQFDRAKEGEALLVDEGVDVFGTMTQRNPLQWSNLKRIIKGRHKKLFIIICSPDMYLIQWYMREKRLRALIRIPKFKRGTVKVYNLDKQTLNFVRSAHKIKFPKTPAFSGWSKAIPKTSEFWKAYWKRKVTIQKKETLSEKEIKKLKKKQENWRKNFLKAKEVAIILEVHQQTVFGWIYQKKLKSYKDMAGNVWIKKKDFEKFKNKRQRMKIK